MRWPQDASGSAQGPPLAGGGPGEGVHVRPVHGQRVAGVLELLRDGSFQQVIAGAGEIAGRQPVRLVFGEGVRDQAEGPFGLPVGQPVRAVFPLRDHAEPELVACGQAGQGAVHAGQVGGPPVGQGQAHAGQQGADGQLPPAHPGGQHGLDPRRGAGGVDGLLQHPQRDHGRAAPSSLTACSSPAGSRPARRSPRRWEQLIPAACMNVARPGSSAASASRLARSRDVFSRGRPVSAI